MTLTQTITITAHDERSCLSLEQYPARFDDRKVLRDQHAQCLLSNTDTPIIEQRANSCHKCVHFSNTVQVRTHELIVGDYPSCRGGMALECGWAYAVSDNTQLRNSPSKRKEEQLRLNLAERRQRLKDVTGMTSGQLLQADYQVRTSSRISCKCSHDAVSNPKNVEEDVDKATIWSFHNARKRSSPASW